jgi:hypothetical protein
MSFSTIAATEAIARQDAAFKRQMDARLARRRQAMGSRVGSFERVGEALACPRCRTEYGFGIDCPDCAVALMGVSSLPEVYSPSVSPSWVPGLLAMGATFALFAVTFGSIVLFLIGK